MDEINIEKLVENFFAWQEIRFSEIWKRDVTSRVERYFKGIDNVSEDQVYFEINKTHQVKIIEIKESAKQFLRNLFEEDITEAQVDISVDQAWDVFQRNFDANETIDPYKPELNYLKRGARLKAITIIRRDSTEVGGIRIKVESLEDFPGFDPKGKDFPFDEEQRIKTEFLDNKQISITSAREIFRYYSIFNRVKEPEREGGSFSLKALLRHKKESLKKIHKEVLPPDHFELTNLNSQTKYYKKRWKILRSADERKWMELAISKLRESMEKKILDLSEISDNDTEKRNEIEKAPLLSSVLVSADGQFFTSYKGQDHKTNSASIEKNRTPWSKHCEYSLFVDVVKENKNITEGATLYVTLEPCNSRKPIKNSNPREPKIPCAVRCVEMGIKKIYIGTLDYNEGVFGKGHRILQTGKYEFKLNHNQKHKGKNEEEIEGAELLEEYFKNKNYPLVSDNRESRIYKIGDPLEAVTFFDDDLMWEINNINAQFQSKYNKSAFNSE